MDKYKKKRIIRAAAVLTFAALLLMPCLPIHGEAEIYRKVLRLHVIADSDSPEDQSIKLSVRDAVLDVIPDILGECRTYDEAKTALADENNQAVLLAAARERLKELGAGCDAAITLGEEYYPTREYDGVRLPAGKYTSLRIVLGSGSGKNWWCVLFPSLCLSAARRSAAPAGSDITDDAENPRGENYIAAGFTPEQYRTITETDAPRYRIRFRILELIGELTAAN